MDDCDGPVGAKAWASDWRAFVALWVVPGAAMLAALLLEPALRGVVWTGMLVWMGVAFLLNARRCARIHCRVTGPFLLAMAGLAAAYATGAAPLGPHGGSLLGGASLVSFAGLWWGSERLWGQVRAASTPISLIVHEAPLVRAAHRTRLPAAERRVGDGQEDVAARRRR